MIGLVDGNNFYVSCERVFDPALKYAKVVVLSNNDGCIISRSNEVKALGIKMGQPIFELKDVIERENIKVLSSNFALYGDMSSRMMSVISEFSTKVEIYSIDEAFLDLSFIPADTLALGQYGREIRNRIKMYTGIPCGIGISHTKVLAKIANRIAKKSTKANGVLALVDDKHIDYALSITKVGDIWGIGRQYSKLLERNGIKTALDLRDADEKWVLKKMTIVGSHIQRELRKQSCIPLEKFANKKKSIIVSRSFSNYIKNFDGLLAPLTHFVSSGCGKLRKQKSETAQIGVYLRTNPFATHKKQYSAFQVAILPFYTSCDFHVLRAAVECLKSIYKEGYDYKKSGVYFFGLKNESNCPSNLFDTRDIVKERALFSSFDAVKDRFGHNAITLALALDYSWKPKFIKKSRSYTTNISELMTVL